MSEFYFTEALGNFKLFYAPECDSTNLLVRSLLPTYDSTGPVALYSFHQKKGRGQGSNLWVSLPGENLALTIALDIKAIGGSAIALNKLVTLGVAEAISAICGKPALIKWPNDIMVDNKKVSGLLMESGKEQGYNFFFAGIGINVNQRYWPEEFHAVGLAEVFGQSIDLNKVVHDVIVYISKFINELTNNKSSNIDVDFNGVLWQKGKWLHLEIESRKMMEGRILEVDTEGRLVFEDKAGHTMRLHHGQVRISKNNSAFFNS